MGYKELDKFVPKGWGYEEWIVNNEKYCGKILFFVKGKKCSWHFHKLKHETFYIQEGSLKVTYGFDEDILKSKTIILNKGDIFEVPIGLVHQMEAIVDTKMFEFSTKHLDEDSYRITKGD